MALGLTGRLVRFAASAAAVVSLGCGTTYVEKSNAIDSSASKSGNSNAAVSAGTASSPNVLEPDRYFANVTATLDGRDASPRTLSFSFARLAADRRWAFELTQGQVIYLEKSGLKYLVFPTRGQYAEVSPGNAGFQAGDLISPNVAWARLKSRVAERLGVEPVNGRTTIKYRYAAASPGEKSEFLFVDQEIGLTIRSELNPVREKEGSVVRLIIDARDLQLNPDRSKFDVPSGMKKVPADQLKAQIASLTEALRPYLVFF
jgi:hypothetical protein